MGTRATAIVASGLTRTPAYSASLRIGRKSSDVELDTVVLRIRFVRFSGRALTEGIKPHRIEGLEVPAFEPAKAIVDCLRYRNEIGLDIALEGPLLPEQKYRQCPLRVGEEISPSSYFWQRG